MLAGRFLKHYNYSFSGPQGGGEQSLVHFLNDATEVSHLCLEAKPS